MRDACLSTAKVLNHQARKFFTSGFGSSPQGLYRATSSSSPFPKHSVLQQLGHQSLRSPPVRYRTSSYHSTGSNPNTVAVAMTLSIDLPANGAGAPTVTASNVKDIIASLPERFVKAKESGDLLFFPSTVHKYSEDNVEFEIRLCPALQQKPNLPTPHFNAEEDTKKPEKELSKPDPFAPPYNRNLLIGELKDEEEGAEYVVLFNKYSVVPHHILLVTKEFHSQTAPPLSSDLVQTYQLLQAARASGRRFFAFYNCGNLSGASQPHKHLQLIPIEDNGPPIDKLARSVNLEVPNKPFTLNSLPYANHVYRLPSHLGPTTDPYELSDILTSVFMSLLDLAISSIRHDPSYPAGPPSYNVILTLEHLHVIPRREEWYVLEETKEKMSVNSMGFAGLLLVKSEREMEAVKKEGVRKILRGTGVGSVHELQVRGNDGEQDSAA